MTFDRIERFIQVAQQLIRNDPIVPFQVLPQLFRDGIAHEPTVIPFLLDGLDIDFGNSASLFVGH